MSTPISFPVLPLRNEMYDPGQTAQTGFKRLISKRAAEAAFAQGRLAVIARQLDPREDRPERRDLDAQGKLVEIVAMERSDNNVLAVTIHVLRPVQIIKTVFTDPYLQMLVADSSTGHELRRDASDPRDALGLDWLPTRLHTLYRYLSQQLRIDLDHSSAPLQTELTLQHRVSNAIARWLHERSLAEDFKLGDNLHMPRHGTFCDVLIEHVAGQIAIEVKKNDRLDPLLDDARKLRSYVRGAGSPIKAGVLVFPTDRDLPRELTRSFIEDPALILVPCLRR